MEVVELLLSHGAAAKIDVSILSRAHFYEGSNVLLMRNHTLPAQAVA